MSRRLERRVRRRKVSNTWVEAVQELREKSVQGDQFQLNRLLSLGAKHGIPWARVLQLSFHEVSLQATGVTYNIALRVRREPHLGDSWCLACTAVEAITGELKAGWGAAGTRAVAADLLVSATRQIRALRRLGIAGAGKSRPSAPAGAPPGRSSSVHPGKGEGSGAEQKAPAPPPPPPRAERSEQPEESAPVKREPAPEEESGDSEGEESEEQAEDKEVQPEASGLKAAPKTAARSERGSEARGNERSEIPRRRTHERSEHHRDRSRDRRQDSSRGHERDRDRRRHHEREAEERRSDKRRSRSRHRTREEQPRSEKPKSKKKRKRPGHRAGSHHQRLHRALQDPYKRFHQKPPASFWDEGPSFD
eukprot:s489_g14.t1